MITVKIFGTYRLKSVKGELRLNAGTVKQVLVDIGQNCPELSEQELKQAILFVNKQQITGRRRLSMRLKDGDELVLISPMCGG
jgi:molybdopterin converting factor small subunit